MYPGDYNYDPNQHPNRVRVVVTGVDMPFTDLVRFMFKCVCAAIPAVLVLVFVVSVFASIFIALFSGAISSMIRPDAAGKEVATTAQAPAPAPVTVVGPKEPGGPGTVNMILATPSPSPVPIPDQGDEPGPVGKVYDVDVPFSIWSGFTPNAASHKMECQPPVRVTVKSEVIVEGQDWLKVECSRRLGDASIGWILKDKLMAVAQDDVEAKGE